ncbi:MAG: hypothetical protein WC126_09770 [Proteiniphilum sp.]|nr:hypothetical protein [Proteiniphilum sp.]
MRCITNLIGRLFGHLPKKAEIQPVAQTVADGNGPLPKLSIEYVTEYNINKEGDGLATSHAGSQCGYFSWKRAMKEFDKINIDGIYYHLPSRSEWRGIIPDFNNGKNIRFDQAEKTSDYSEQITIAGQTHAYTAAYRSDGCGIAYGLRFKGHSNVYLSAWRYAYKDHPDGEGKIVEVTARRLDPEFKGTVEDIARESWWSRDNGKDLSRVFPAADVTMPGSNDVCKAGVNGCYWSRSHDNGLGNAWFFCFDEVGAFSDYRCNQELTFFVRLFACE